VGPIGGSLKMTLLQIDWLNPNLTIHQWKTTSERKIKNKKI